MSNEGRLNRIQHKVKPGKKKIVVVEKLDGHYYDEAYSDDRQEFTEEQVKAWVDDPNTYVIIVGYTRMPLPGTSTLQDVFSG